MPDGPLQATSNGGNRFFRTLKDTFFSTSSRTSVTGLPVPDKPQEAEETPSTRQLTDQDRSHVSSGSRSASALRGGGEEETKTIRSPLTTDSGLGKRRSRTKKKGIVSSSTAVPRVEVCTGKKCTAKGGKQLLSAFQAASSGGVEIAYTTCMKACKQGMNVRVTKDGTTFDMHNEVAAQDCQQILSKHFEW